MNFNSSTGEDYYSQFQQNPRDEALLKTILESIETFNWAEHNIKDSSVKRALAIKISDEIERSRKSP